MARKLYVYLLVAAVAVTGCSGSGKTGEPRTVEIQAGNMLFVTREISLEKGQPVKLVLKNQDIQLHDFSIDKIPAKVKDEDGGSHDMRGKMPDLHLSAEAGKAATVEFTPTAKGTYNFYCTVAGHREAGMQGTLVVE